MVIFVLSVRQEMIEFGRVENWSMEFLGQILIFGVVVSAYIQVGLVVVILKEFEKNGRRREKDNGEIVIGVDGSSADMELRYVEIVVF